MKRKKGEDDEISGPFDEEESIGIGDEEVDDDEDDDDDYDDDDELDEEDEFESDDDAFGEDFKSDEDFPGDPSELEKGYGDDE